MPHDLGTFRSLLAAPPSQQSFEAIIEAIDFFDDDLDMLALYLRGNLARWPAHVPRHVPEIALIASASAHLSPLISLCNTLHADHVLDVLDALTFKALVRSTLLDSITTLHLDGWTEEARCLALLESAHLTSLHTLTCRHTEHYASTLVDVIGRARTTFSLHTLDLRSSSLRTLDPLLRSPCITSLTHLHLSHNRLDDEAITQLAALALPHLTHLDLRYNALGEDAARALARATFPSLQWLDLHLRDIGPEGALALSESATLPAAVRRYWRAQCPP